MTVASRKPLFRGIPDLVGVLAAIPAVFWMAQHAEAGPAKAAAWIYGLSLIFLLGISSLYHVPYWPQKTRELLRRLDQSAIFILIAGSYAPPCLVVLEGKAGVPLLVGVWVGAVVGVTLAFALPRTPRVLNVILAIGLGWAVVPFGATILGALRVHQAVLLATGGVLYSLGALIYLRRWPNPWPQFWGYHEIFHVFVVAAVACHFTVFASLTSG